MLSNFISRAVVTLFQSFAMLRRDQIIFPAFESLRFFISWWTSASGDLASDEVLLTNLLLMTTSLQEHLYFRCTFLQMLQASFLLIPLLSFVLPKPYNDIKFLSMVLYTWTNISISNWQFLIPCYHQNSKEVVLNTFCSNNLPLFDDDKH